MDILHGPWCFGSSLQQLSMLSSFSWSREVVFNLSLCRLQVGHEPLPSTVGTTMFGRRVLYLPGFFSYGEWGVINQYLIVSLDKLRAADRKWICFSARHIVKVDGKSGLFRGLSPRIVSSAISTVIRSKVKQVGKGWEERLYTYLYSLTSYFLIWRLMPICFWNILYVSGHQHNHRWRKIGLLWHFNL